MSAVIIPKYCNKTGCWSLATVHAKDCQNHPVNSCAEHVQWLLADRSRIYAEGRKMAEYWRIHWEEYEHLSRFK